MKLPEIYAKFCRKNAQTGEYEPKWFLREEITFQDLENLLIECQEEDRNKLISEVSKYFDPIQTENAGNPNQDRYNNIIKDRGAVIQILMNSDL